jgi:hypothetical protein
VFVTVAGIVDVPSRLAVLLDDAGGLHADRHVQRVQVGVEPARRSVSRRSREQHGREGDEDEVQRTTQRNPPRNSGTIPKTIVFL